MSRQLIIIDPAASMGPAGLVNAPVEQVAVKLVFAV
jgi:hypothetical protein